MNLELIEHPRANVLAEDFSLSQTMNIALRLMKAGYSGLTTAELFRGLHSAKYTARISELRQQGHSILATKIGGSRDSTAQWLYRYDGYLGKDLPGELTDALFTWMKLPIEAQ